MLRALPEDWGELKQDEWDKLIGEGFLSLVGWVLRVPSVKNLKFSLKSPVGRQLPHVMCQSDNEPYGIDASPCSS